MEPILTHVPPQVSWVRTRLRGKTRILMAWIFGAALVLSAREAPTLPGILVCFLGATLRFWASGYLRKDATPSVGGPYAFTRNPLYLGTYLMALGTALAVGNPWLLGSATVAFAVIYHFIILEEEIKLREIFGPAYLRYTELVPRFFPRPWPASVAMLDTVNPRRELRRFSLSLAWRNKAYEAYAAFAALIGLTGAIALAWKFFTVG
ncbi:MAG: isoprenylcysteine carboxylmethyltransferase family protein [Bdellovibrionales bacterium]|nr:isoprenylcysteine carboxylmethyltransferase family protein [Bdellovibrionales bacterium]